MSSCNLTPKVQSDSIRQASKKMVVRPEGTHWFPPRVAGFKKRLHAVRRVPYGRASGPGVLVPAANYPQGEADDYRNTIGI
jgi:hypothetical protein